jgi:hypothetical protein
VSQDSAPNPRLPGLACYQLSQVEACPRSYHCIPVLRVPPVCQQGGWIDADPGEEVTPVGTRARLHGGEGSLGRGAGGGPNRSRAITAITRVSFRTESARSVSIGRML